MDILPHSEIHLDNACRACMSCKADMEPLLSDSLADIYTECTSLTVLENDLLPKKLCIECIKILKSLHEFRVLCHSSEAAFISYITYSKIESAENNSHNIKDETSNSIILPEIKTESEELGIEYEPSSPLADSSDSDSSKIKVIKLKKHKSKASKLRNQGKEKAKRLEAGHCSLCNKSFAYSAALEKHQLICGRDGKIKINKIQKIVLPKPTVLMCGLCSEEYKTYESLNAHLEKHRQDENFICSLCQYTGVDWADFLCHRYFHQPTEYSIQIKCWACTNRFSSIDRLEFHIRREHLGKRPGLCRVCHKEFMNINNWRAHKDIHRGIKSNKCKICGKSFTCNRSLVLHLRCHSDEKKYVCQTCGISFRFRTGLTSHLTRRHSDVEPLICNHCGKNFKNKQTLREHLLRTTEMKNFKCAQCENCYRTQKELNRHAKWHSDIKPFPCSQCGKAYKSNHHLTSHMRKHTGEKPFPCDICNNSFMTSSVLKKHRLIHTGLKPHTCPYCGKSFIEKCNLKKHLKTHGQLNLPQFQDDIVMSKLSF